MNPWQRGGKVHALLEKAFGERARAIENRLLLAAGTGKDLAVFETWEGNTLTLRFELMEPDGPLPANCTVYRISQLATGRA